MRNSVFGVALLMLSSAAIAGDQFDLVCNVKSKDRPLGNWNKKTFSVRYRIDLVNQAWCAETCTEVESIQSVEPGRLLLEKSDPADSKAAPSHHVIDRVSGRVQQLINAEWFYYETEGTCERAQFSGLPSPKF